MVVREVVPREERCRILTYQMELIGWRQVPAIGHGVREGEAGSSQFLQSCDAASSRHDQVGVV